MRQDRIILVNAMPGELFTDEELILEGIKLESVSSVVGDLIDERMLGDWDSIRSILEEHHFDSDNLSHLGFDPCVLAEALYKGMVTEDVAIELITSFSPDQVNAILYHLLEDLDPDEQQQCAAELETMLEHRQEQIASGDISRRRLQTAPAGDMQDSAEYRGRNQRAPAHCRKQPAPPPEYDECLACLEAPYHRVSAQALPEALRDELPGYPNTSGTPISPVRAESGQRSSVLHIGSSVASRGLCGPFGLSRLRLF